MKRKSASHQTTERDEGAHIKSWVLLSASANSISSIPSSIYQCKYARRLYMVENYYTTACQRTWNVPPNSGCTWVRVRMNASWIEVEFDKQVADCSPSLIKISPKDPNEGGTHPDLAHRRNRAQRNRHIIRNPSVNDQVEHGPKSGRPSDETGHSLDKMRAILLLKVHDCVL
jgi:hypothetical protein